VVADDGVRGLLRVELEAFGHFNTDATGFEQFGHLGVVGEVRAGRVAPGVTTTAVLLAEESEQGGAVFVGVGQAG